VRGRRSGRVYETPVDVMDVGGRRWLVAAYGPGNVRPYFDAGPESTDEALLAELPRHPVFALIPLGAAG
jgi:hypothetical protein